MRTDELKGSGNSGSLGVHLRRQEAVQAIVELGALEAVLRDEDKEAVQGEDADKATARDRLREEV